MCYIEINTLLNTFYCYSDASKFDYLFSEIASLRLQLTLSTIILSIIMIVSWFDSKADKAEMKADRAADKAEMKANRAEDKKDMSQQYYVTTLIAFVAVAISLIKK